MDYNFELFKVKLCYDKKKLQQQIDDHDIGIRKNRNYMEKIPYPTHF